MPITPQSAKAKGRKFQQQVRDQLLADFAELLGPDDIRSTSMGASGDDLLLSPLARLALPYNFELKKQQTPSLWAAFDQASRRSTEVPVAVFSCNHMKLSDAAVAVPQDHFRALLLGVPNVYDISRPVPTLVAAATTDQVPADCQGWTLHNHSTSTYNLWKEWPALQENIRKRFWNQHAAVFVTRNGVDLALLRFDSFMHLILLQWRTSPARAKLFHDHQPVAATGSGGGALQNADTAAEAAAGSPLVPEDLDLDHR